MASKSRSSLSGTPNKTTPATPRVSKLGRRVSKAESESPLPLRNSHSSIDRSPRSVNSKLNVERKSPKPSTIDRQLPRVVKVSELQTQLNVAQEDLKKAKEQLNQAENEKAKIIDELREAHKATEEANEKLREAFMAQKRAEENSEIEKFRAVELEQAGIEAVNKKEEEWQKEIESVRNQHALDVAALLLTTQELQRVKQELAMTCDAKNQAQNHADDATKIAETHLQKSEILSAELTQLKAILDLKLEAEANENKILFKLKTEIDTLRQELDEAKAYEEKFKAYKEKAKAYEEMAKCYEEKVKDFAEKAKVYEEKLVQKDTFIEQLNVDLEAAKMAESYAHSLLEECQKRIDELEIRVEEANKQEKSASESLESVMKQLEGNSALLHDAESEIGSLKEKLVLLEMTITRQRGDLEDSEFHVLMAREKGTEMSKKIDCLKAELETIKEEKAQALNNEKLAASSVQTLLEEKNKLINELENSRDEEEKSKKAMESLASALHEISAEARQAKEKLLTYRAGHETYDNRMEDLKLVLKATNEKYKSMLDDARHEIDTLTCSVEKCKNDLETSRVEWEQREHHLVNCIKRSEEENSSLAKEMNRLANLLRQTEEESCAQKEEEAQLKENLREVEAEVIHLQEALKETKIDSMKLKESLLDKENELQSIVQENEELRTREDDSIKKVEELSQLLEEATRRTQTRENDLTDSEKEYDLLPKVVEFSEENGHKGEDISKVELSSNQEELGQNLQEESIFLNDKTRQTDSLKTENGNGKLKEDKNETAKKDNSVEVEFKMWESCKIEKKDFSPEREAESESFEEEVDSKIGDGKSFNQISELSSKENIDDGGNSPSKQHVKKKKPLLGKFGSLLKKRGGSNQK